VSAKKAEGEISQEARYAQLCRQQGECTLKLMCSLKQMQTKRQTRSRFVTQDRACPVLHAQQGLQPTLAHRLQLAPEAVCPLSVNTACRLNPHAGHPRRQQTTNHKLCSLNRPLSPKLL
jgi:hypothetical protein